MSERKVVEFEPKPGSLLACYAIFLAVALVPVFAFDVAPLGDWPNHLARAYILNGLGSNADLQKYYAAHWRLFSFQSTDLILPGLIRVFGLSGANGYVGATFLLLIAGTAAVHRALFGRVGLWPAFATPLLFNLPLAVGQVSFLLAIALGLLLLAGWIATEQHRGVIRTAAFVLGSLALFFCHFLAFVFYAVTVMAFEAARSRVEPTMARRLSRLIEAGLPFVIPAVCFVLAFNGSIHGATAYGDILAKPIAWAAATVTYATWSDIVVTVAIGCALWLLDRRKLLGFAAGMRFPVIVLLLVAVGMPQMLSGVLGADIRIPCLLAFLLVASSDVTWRSRRQAAAFVVGVAVLLSFRVATTMAQWQEFDAGYREFRAADAALDRGSRVMVIPLKVGYPDRRRPLTAYAFVASFAVIDRDVLLPQLYTYATPLEFSPAALATIGIEHAQPPDVRWNPTDPSYAKADPETVRQAEDVARFLSSKSPPGRFIDWSDWPERYDFVIDLNFGLYGNPVPALLTEVGRGSYFSIYRIHPPEPR